MQIHHQIETIDTLFGPTGRLEAIVQAGLSDAPFAAVVCHPHPPSGGTMHTKPVYHAMKALHAFGLPVLRFNFRGVGVSEGVHDHGRGEVEDVRAAINWTAERYQKPILLAGFSFGSNMALQAGCGDSRVQGLIALGSPVNAEGRQYHYDFMQQCTQQKLFVTGADDPFAPRPVLEAILSEIPPPIETVWVDDADHFFQGTPNAPGNKLPVMRAAVEEWIAKTYQLAKV